MNIDYKCVSKKEGSNRADDAATASVSFILSSEEQSNVHEELDGISMVVQNCNLQSTEALHPVVDKLIQVLHDFSPYGEVHKIAFELICLFVERCAHFDNQIMLEMESYCKSLFEAGLVDQIEAPLMFNLVVQISARNPGLFPYGIIHFLPFQKSDMTTIIQNLSRIRLPVRFASHIWRVIINDEIENDQAKILYRIAKHNSLNWDQLIDENDAIRLISKARSSTAALGTLIQLSNKSYICKGYIQYNSDVVRAIISTLLKEEMNNEPRMLMKILSKVDFILDQGEIVKIMKYAETADGGIRVRFNEFLQKQSSMAFNRILEIIVGIDNDEFEKEVICYSWMLKEQERKLAISMAIIRLCNDILRTKFLEGKPIILTTNEREGYNATRLCNMLIEKYDKLEIIDHKEITEYNDKTIEMICDLKEIMEIVVLSITKNEEWEGITLEVKFAIFTEEEDSSEEENVERINQ